MGRHDDRLGATFDAQLVEDCVEVLGDGALGESELSADGLVGAALRHQLQHRARSRAQRSGCPGLGHRPPRFWLGWRAVSGPEDAASTSSSRRSARAATSWKGSVRPSR
jgi:hypothetical protein